MYTSYKIFPLIAMEVCSVFQGETRHIYQLMSPHTHVWLKSSGNVSAKSNAMHHQPSINHKIRLQAELQIKPSLRYRGEAKLPLLHVCRLIRGREKPNPSSLNLLLLPSRHEKWKKEIFRQYLPLH